jgi:peroxiredoxin
LLKTYRPILQSRRTKFVPGNLLQRNRLTISGDWRCVGAPAPAQHIEYATPRNGTLALICRTFRRTLLTVTVQAAPAGRGAAFIVKTALAGLLGVLAVVVPLRANELAPWTGPTHSTPPLFKLTTANGVDVALDSARGQIVLVHFFATWCEHCITELPALNRLVTRSNGSVKVLAISVAEADLRVRRFFEKMPVNFQVLLDRDRATAKAWGVSTLPTTIVLNANLQPKLVAESEFAWDNIDPDRINDMFAAGTREKAAAASQATTKQ